MEKTGNVLAIIMLLIRIDTLKQTTNLPPMFGHCATLQAHDYMVMNFYNPQPFKLLFGANWRHIRN